MNRRGLALRRSATLALGSLGWALVAQPAPAAGVGPGSYCPLPVANERPACLEPARAEYGEVFDAVDGGEVSDAQLQKLEADAAGGAGAKNPYLALSSLTYVYYRLAERAAADPDEDPLVAARLKRFNGLLAGAFEASSGDEAFREAMLHAAEDLRERAPAVTLRCVDAEGKESDCDSTVDLLRGLDAAAGQVGIRGALERLLQRAVGSGDS